MTARPGRRARVLAAASAATMIVALAGTAVALPIPDGPPPGQQAAPPAAPPPVAYESPGSTARVSFDVDGSELADRPADRPAISANGRWVAYAAHDRRDVPSGLVDRVLLYDRRTKETRVVYQGPVGFFDRTPNIFVTDVAISADGQVVAFTTSFDNTAPRVLVWSAASGAVEYPGGEQNILFSAESPSVSADGSSIAMVVRDGGRVLIRPGVYVYTRPGGEFVPVAPSPLRTDPYFGATDISADGSRVAFSTNLPMARGVKTGSVPQVWLFDRPSGGYQLVSRREDGGPGDGTSDQPSISDDGRIVAFASAATDLVPAGENRYADVFTWAEGRGVRRVSNTAAGSAGGGGSSWPSIAGDGSAVAFASEAADLVPGDTSGRATIGARPGGIATAAFVERWPTDVFVVNLGTEQLSRISFGRGPAEADGTSGQPSMSRSGRYVAFASEATNLVEGDGNGRSDVFVRDRPPRVGATPDPVDFGTVRLGSLGVTLPATIRSTGIVPARIGDLTIGGRDAGDFVVASNPCTGQQLPPGATCEVGILFIGTAIGDRVGTLSIANDAGKAITLRLVGSVGRARLRVEPEQGPPGLVVTAIGTGFPENAPITLTWSVGITADPLVPVVSDANGAFTAQMLILPRDREGLRDLRATASVPGIKVDPVRARFLVVPGTAEPPTSGLIQVFAATPGEPIILRR